ncbi:MAG: TIM barrel protein [Bacteroidia bacterium]
MSDRRTFVKKAAGLMAGLGLGMGAYARTEKKTSFSLSKEPSNFPNNPLVLFDNFHVGNRRSYSWKAKFAQAKAAGFDGFEFAVVDPKSDSWKQAMDLVPKTNFKVWGFHWTTQAVVDHKAETINQEIEKIIENVEFCGKSPLKPYYTLSLSGRAELNGPTIHERGSAKAEDRHWERAYKIIAAYDKACRENDVTGALYPHIDWICDTPQSAFKILERAQATSIGPAFCSHHWYANQASDELDEVLKHPLMKRLNYVVMTNGLFRPDGFQAVRFNEGQIDMAWLLAKIYEFGYTGPISSQGWAIGGDPFVACKRFVDTIHALRDRFKKYPELNPLV